MSATYDSQLQTDKDWVRFLTGDHAGGSPTVADPGLQDEEILALLREEPNKYLAAAAAADMIGSIGGAVVSRSLAELSISYTTDGGIAYDEVRRRLREKGAEVELRKSGSHVFRTLGTRT